MAALITSMGLQECPVCHGREGLGLLPWPAIVSIGGHPWKPLGEPHRGNELIFAIVRCESCGHAMFFDSEKFTRGDEPPLWGGPGDEPESGPSKQRNRSPRALLAAVVRRVVAALPGR